MSWFVFYVILSAIWTAIAVGVTGESILWGLFKPYAKTGEMQHWYVFCIFIFSLALWPLFGIMVAIKNYVTPKSLNPHNKNQ